MHKRQTAGMFGLLIFATLIAAFMTWSSNRHPVEAQMQHLTSYQALTIDTTKQVLNSTGSCKVVQLSAPSTNMSNIITGDATIGQTGPLVTGVTLAPGAARQIPGVTPNTSDARIALSTLYIVGLHSGDYLQFDCYN